MEELKLTCEVITPMFMAGADGKTPELRPSEFKGMMRFWWRAIKAEDDIEKLRKEEAEIFGGTKEGEGKSKFAVILTNQVPPSDKIGEDIRREIGENEGLKYLLYSTFALRTRGVPIIRKYIKNGYNFSITLRNLADEKTFKQALASLWLAIYLGGFGTRARRGSGCIIVKNVEGNNITGIDFIPKGKNKSEIKYWFEGNLNEIKKIMFPLGTQKYSNLKNSKIFIFDGKSKNSWQDALNFIGTKFKSFRDKYKSHIFETAAFGMPIMHSGFSIRMVPYKGNKRLSERRASPLIIKVIKSENSYFPVIIKLNGDIVFNGKVGKEKREGNKWNAVEIKPVMLTKVDEFLSSLKNFTEVISL